MSVLLRDYILGVSSRRESCFSLCCVSVHVIIGCSALIVGHSTDSTSWCVVCVVCARGCVYFCPLTSILSHRMVAVRVVSSLQ